MRTKSQQQVLAEIATINKAIAQLENKQARLNVLSQFQKQGATRKHLTWKVSGNQLVKSS